MIKERKESKASYKINGSVVKAESIFDVIAEAQTPATPAYISEQLDMSYNTVMDYIATLVKIDRIEKVGEGYQMSAKEGKLWAKRVSIVKYRKNTCAQELTELGAVYE